MKVLSRSWRLSALSFLVVLTSALPALAEDEVSANQVVLVPADGVTLTVDGRTYAGAVTVSSGSSGGLAVVEETTIDRYLLGIAEVPFSWPLETLRAQAIAARTYLAWTLERGRSQNGRRYDYDICATDQCQVYRGLDGVAGSDGGRWRSAVESTGNQILFDGDSPLQALYSSTSGGRTRSVEDVFGSAPNPFLSAVPSPNEASPFAEWRFAIEESEMVALASEAGHLRGELVGVRTRVSADGEGPWLVEFIGTDGVVAVPTWNLRTDLNRAARNALPDRFPVQRPDRPDRRYPQTIMSPSFTINEAQRYINDGSGPPVFESYFEVRGNGWGHLVGMSQYGAEAMAAAGAGASEILSHYYGGLFPQSAEEALPPTVRVGLTTSSDVVEVVPDGAVSLILDGEVIEQEALGRWSFTGEQGSVLVTPPVGLGLPPDIKGLSVFESQHGQVELVAGRLVAAGEIRLVIESGPGAGLATDWTVEEAGNFFFLPDMRSRALRPVRITVESRNAIGSDSVSISVVPRAG